MGSCSKRKLLYKAKVACLIVQEKILLEVLTLTKHRIKTDLAEIAKYYHKGSRNSSLESTIPILLTSWFGKNMYSDILGNFNAKVPGKFTAEVADVLVMVIVLVSDLLLLYSVQDTYI
jgi:hypothetical protein